LLHPLQQDFSAFSIITAEAEVNKPVNIRTTAIKTKQETALKSIAFTFNNIPYVWGKKQTTDNWGLN